MCVKLNAEAAITSFYSCISEKLKKEGKNAKEIIDARYTCDSIVNFAKLISRYDDVIRCYNEESLRRLIMDDWKDIFTISEDGYIQLKKDSYLKYELEEDYNGYAQPIVVYLVNKFPQRWLHKYSPEFLRKINVYSID